MLGSFGRWRCLDGRDSAGNGNIEMLRVAEAARRRAFLMYRSNECLQRNRSGGAAKACGRRVAAPARRRPTYGRGAGAERRNDFLAKLAETSNIRQAAVYAGVSPTTVYDLSRSDPGFAQRWLDTLCQGYDNLEMEMLYHLRAGERGGDAPKFTLSSPRACCSPIARR